MIPFKLTKSAILATLKSAIAASQAANGAPVKVDLPGWEGYELRSFKARMSKVQQYPSTVIKVRHVATKATAWDTTAGYLPSIAARMAKNAKELDGWCGPVTSSHIPWTHPAYSV